MFALAPGRRFSTFVVVLLAVFSPVLFGENFYFESKDLSTLAVPSIRDIARDGQGYIYAATPGGVVRLDGLRTVLMDRSFLVRLPSDDILSLEYHENGSSMLIGTDAGLLSYNLRNGTETVADFEYVGNANARYRRCH